MGEGLLLYGEGLLLLPFELHLMALGLTFLLGWPVRLGELRFLGGLRLACGSGLLAGLRPRPFLTGLLSMLASTDLLSFAMVGEGLKC